jgi:hypothetical protein
LLDKVAAGVAVGVGGRRSLLVGGCGTTVRRGSGALGRLAASGCSVGAAAGLEGGDRGVALHPSAAVAQAALGVPWLVGRAEDGVRWQLLTVGEGHAPDYPAG